MKKSQILAALALAFALGVVAPVAGTYAQITPNTATDEQKEAIYEEANDALEIANDLDNLSDYKYLYDAIEGDNGIAASLNKIADSELRWFNENLTVSQSVNGYIAQAAKYIGTTSTKLYAKNADGTYKYIKANVSFADAELKTISQFTKVNSLKDAYNALIAASKAVEDNISTLKNNYTYDGNAATATVVEDAVANYDAIRSHLSSELDRINKAFKDATPWDYDAKGWGAAIINVNTTAANLANAIKNIDASAYDALVKNQDWTATPTTGVERATDFDLVIKAAKALPKYNFVNAVSKAMENVEKILSPANAGDPTVNVDYTKAQAYIAALKVAVKAYEEGKAPIVNNPDDETNNGSNAGDDTQDPSAPGTGLVSTAEGNAATTVSIVAGLATALTALGAGVVAYRSARRSNK